jgi:hypothetical protein
VVEFKENLLALYSKCGTKGTPVTFLLTDNQVRASYPLDGWLPCLLPLQQSSQHEQPAALPIPCLVHATA